MHQLVAIIALNRASANSHAGSYQVFNLPPWISGWECQQGLKQLDNSHPKPQPHRAAKGRQHLCYAERPVIPAGNLHLVGESDVNGGVGDVLLHLIQEVCASGGGGAWQRTDILWRHQSSLEEIAVDSLCDFHVHHPLGCIDTSKPEREKFWGIVPPQNVVHKCLVTFVVALVLVGIVHAAFRCVLLDVLHLLKFNKKLFVGALLPEVLDLYLWTGLGELGEPVRPVDVVKPVLDVDLHCRRFLCVVPWPVVQEEVKLADALHNGIFSTLEPTK